MEYRAINYLGLLTVLAVASMVGGCGGDEDNAVPSDGIATVGNTVISRGMFERQVHSQSAGNMIGPRKAPYEPPRYATCVQAKLKIGSEQQPRSAAQAKKECEQEYRKLRVSTLSSMVRAVWIEQEAKARGIHISDARLKALFYKSIPKIFPNKDAYGKYLRKTGLRLSDALAQFRGHELEQRINAQVMAPGALPPEHEIVRQYKRNMRVFQVPEQRRIRLVQTHTEAAGRTAKRALLAGESWTSVATRYSVDKATARAGGLVPRAQKTDYFPAYDKAVFTAQIGVIGGPVQAGKDWEVFVVERTYPSRTKPLREVRKALIKAILAARQEDAYKRFSKKLQAAHRGHTLCADDLKIAECSNAPTGTNNPA